MTPPARLYDVGDIVLVAARNLPSTGDPFWPARAERVATPGGREPVRSRPTHATDTNASNAAGMPAEDPPGGQAPGSDTSPRLSPDPGAPELNVLPEGHTREDYDFEYKAGRGPIRLSGWESFGHVEPPHVWCIRHGWEIEVFS